MARPIAKSGPDMQALHDLLRAESERRGAAIPGFDKGREPTPGIHTAIALLRLLSEAVAIPDWERADAVMRLMPLHDAMLAQPRYAGHAPHVAHLAAAVAGRSAPRVATHLHRLSRIVRLVAADRVFADGERVSISRTRHAWHDRHLVGTVKPGSGGRVVVDASGEEHEIEHPRDIR